MAPATFHGTLAELFRDHITKVLPDADVVRHFHDRLVEYVATPDPLFVCKTVAGLTRGATLRLPNGRMRPSDNSPAWMIHRLLFEGTEFHDAHRFERMLELEIPCHFHQMSRIATINGAGWHVAHIFNAKDGNVGYLDWTRTELARRFIRNIHPCNCFFVPKAEWVRYGGDANVLAFAAHAYRERYRAIWPAFLELAGVSDLPHVPAAGEHRISLSPRTPTSTFAAVPPLAGETVVEYQAARLLFRRAVIEGLDADQRFRVITRDHGVFEFSRRDFERVFDHILLTTSWQRDGIYHMKTPPQKSLEFRVQPPR